MSTHFGPRFKQSRTPSKPLLLVLVAVLFFHANSVMAQNSDSENPISSRDSTELDQDMGYDDIVKSLQTQEQQDRAASERLAVKKTKVTIDPFANVWMHGGFGWATSYQSLSDSRGRELQINQKGIQATLGIDLFSANWEAEGAARSMGDESDRGDNVSLKEFDLKIFYKNRLNHLAQYRAGGGLSGRYLSLHTSGASTQNYTTPAAVATFGLDMYLSKELSVGIDTSLRSSLIADTVDRSSIDAVMRLDAHF